MLGQLLAQRDRGKGARVLTEVRVYSGRPDATRQPKAYGAHMKQASVWERDGVKVIPRMLRYPHDWPRQKPEEKGIDVALALDFVGLAHRDEYDVGVIFSTDTDLKPALEMVRRDYPHKDVEVAAWRSPVQRNRLWVPGVWCHFLTRSDCDAVADARDYNR